LRLAAGVTVRGVLRGPQGGVAHAAVRVQLGLPWGESPSATTDAEGRFALVAVPRRKVQLLVQGYDITAGKEVDAIHPVDNWVVQVQQRPALHGRVVHRGAPVADVTVWGGTAIAQTDEGGRFALTGLPQGPIELAVRSEH